MEPSSLAEHSVKFQSESALLRVGTPSGLRVLDQPYSRSWVSCPKGAQATGAGRHRRIHWSCRQLGDLSEAIDHPEEIPPNPKTLSKRGMRSLASVTFLSTESTRQIPLARRVARLGHAGCRWLLTRHRRATPFSPQALWTAAHEQLPVTFVVINNRVRGWPTTFPFNSMATVNPTRSMRDQSESVRLRLRQGAAPIRAVLCARDQSNGPHRGGL